MTIKEMDAATAAQSNQFVPVGAFTKAFRTDELTNIEAGEEFEIPENYQVFSQRIMRGGQPVVDAQGKPVTAEFINVVTNTKRNVRFYPTSITKIAFAVDDNGKDLVGAERIVRSSGDLYNYCKGKPINDVMQALKGCTVKCVKLTPVKVRAFGVANDDATAKDVQKNNIGEWTLVGEKKPEGWA